MKSQPAAKKVRAHSQPPDPKNPPAESLRPATNRWQCAALLITTILLATWLVALFVLARK